MDRETLDKLAYVLTLNTEREGIQEALEHEFADGSFSQKQVDELVQFRKANSSIFGKDGIIFCQTDDGVNSRIV